MDNGEWFTYDEIYSALEDCYKKFGFDSLPDSAKRIIYLMERIDELRKE